VKNGLYNPQTANVRLKVTYTLRLWTIHLHTDRYVADKIVCKYGGTEVKKSFPKLTIRLRKLKT